MVSVDNLSDTSPGIAAKDHAFVSGPVYMTNGIIIANDFDDIWDGTIANNLLIDESGNAINTAGGSGSGRLTWTGDASNYNSAGVIGTSPLGNGGNSAQTGDPITASWHSYGGHVARSPDTSLRVYALSEVITVAAIPEPSTAVLATLGLIGICLRRRK